MMRSKPSGKKKHIILGAYREKTQGCRKNRLGGEEK